MVDCRYVSTLTLHQVQLDQTGTYTATASNEDSREDVIFYLQVTGERDMLTGHLRGIYQSVSSLASVSLSSSSKDCVSVRS